MVVCRDVAKRFHVYEHRTASLRELFIRLLRRERITALRPYFALAGLDLTIRRGEAVALIGANGSGKSTVLRLLAGVYPPSGGEILISGRIAAVLALGTGFHPELSGWANIRLYASILGLGRREVAQRLDAIAASADIGAFIDMPVKYYSTGMQARLAFAVAMSAEPDILLLDEVLAVGDAAFQERCLAHLRRYRASGRTLVVVSHDLDVVTQLCERAVWLEAGRIRMSGEVDTVVDAYRTALHR